MTALESPTRDDILPFVATEATLPNGLRVIAVPTGFPNLVSLQIPVQTGSRNEVEAGKSGFAHFFEHVMFRGTPRYPAHAYQEILTRAGARQNAYTTDDFTNYHTTFPKEALETILEIEADRFMNLSYSVEAFQTEARAILGEYNKSSADPLMKLFEVQRNEAYRLHPYKHTTMGFLADIEAMPDQYDYSRLFFERWYRPGYTTVLVAGDIEPGRVVELVERHWGAWAPGEGAIDIPAEPPQTGPVAAHVPWATSTIPWVTAAFHGPAFSETEKDWAALDLLLDLAFGETSDLYQRLVERERSVDQLFPHLPATLDPGLATVLARVKRLDDMAAVREAILETVAGVRRRPLAARRVEEAKAHARYAFARTLDNSESIAAVLAGFVRFRRSYETLNQVFRLTASLTPDDLHRAALRYLSEEGLVVTTLSHEPLPAAASASPAFASRPPAGRGDAGIPFVVQRSPLPLLRFKLQFEAGSAYDLPGKEGLAALAASLVAEAGSEELRVDEINRALFPMAGSFDALVDRETCAFSGVTHRDNLEAFLDIALPQLTRPGLREEDFERLRARQLNTLVQDLRSSNEEELARERLQTLFFAGTPYGHTSLGTVAGIESLTVDDVRGFMGTHYTRENLVAGLAGAFPEGFEQRLQEDLTLPAGPKPALPPFEARRPRGLEVEVVEKDTRAVTIALGHPIEVTRAHPDFAALWVARSWLGEHRASSGRLFQRIREVRGMNYGDYAYIEAFPGAMYRMAPDANHARRAQLFEIWIRPVVPGHALMALKIALHELQRLIDDGLARDQFEMTRDYLAKSVHVMLRTQDQQLGYALDSRWYGMGDFAETMCTRLEALEVDAVNAAVRRHLSWKDMGVVMVAANAAALREELLARAATRVVYDAPRPADVLEEDQRIGGRDLAIQRGAVTVTPVEDVFAR
jgi:zinc protease